MMTQSASGIQAIFFDFGDVLATFNHMKSCEALAAFSTKSPEDIYAILFDSKLEELHYNRGEYADEEWYRLCTNLLELQNCPYEVFAEKWGAIFGSNPDMDRLIAELRPEIRKFVLSNTNGLHWTWAKKNMPILSTYFPNHQQAILSHEAKSRKPEREIYECALRLAAVRPEQAIFIDDKIENVRAFEELGVHGIVYSFHTPITALREELSRLVCL